MYISIYVYKYTVFWLARGEFTMASCARARELFHDSKVSFEGIITGIIYALVYAEREREIESSVDARSETTNKDVYTSRVYICIYS